jgi:transcriptional repressor NrdR
VAYVRFASVYRNFREARDFNTIVDELEGEPEPGTAPSAPKTKETSAP